jgi:SAM-dependent methyltransferase
MKSRTTEEILAELAPAPPQADGYEKFVFQWDRPFFAERIEMAGLTGGELALDAGCGFGQFSYGLAQFNAKVIAIDRAPWMCEAARDLAAKWDVANLTVEQRALPVLPYETGIFDNIWCSGALMFVDRDAVMHQFHRLLRPGGRLYVMLNGWGRWLAKAALGRAENNEHAVRISLKALGVPATASGPPNHLDLDAVADFCEPRGFSLLAAGREGSVDLTGQGRARPMFPSRVVLRQDGEKDIEFDGNIEFVAERRAGAPFSKPFRVPVVEPYSVLTFGTCLVNLVFRERVTDVEIVDGLRDIPSRNPSVLTIAEATQALRLLRGELDMPAAMRPWCGLDPGVGGSVRTRKAVGGLDFVFLEPNTAIMLSFGDYYLNRFDFYLEVLRPLEALGPEALNAGRAWHNQGILQGNEDVRATAAEHLAPLIQGDDEIASLKRAAVLEARPSRADPELILAQMREFVSLVLAPVGIVTYVHQYMPDGRATEWTPGFNDSVVAAAATLGLPCFEPSRLVQQYGVPIAMREDRLHYAESFEPIVAAALADFMVRSVRGSAAIADAR